MQEKVLTSIADDTDWLGGKMSEKPTRYELRTRFRCLDCYIDTLPEPHDYHLHEEVWLEACPGWVGHLCLKCLRVRLRRSLKLSDFMLEYEINNHVTQELLNEVNS